MDMINPTCCINKIFDKNWNHGNKMLFIQLATNSLLIGRICRKLNRASGK